MHPLDDTLKRLLSKLQVYHTVSRPTPTVRLPSTACCRPSMNAAGRQMPEPSKPVLTIYPNLCTAQTIALQLGLHMRGAGGTTHKAGCIVAPHLHGVFCF